MSRFLKLMLLLGALLLAACVPPSTYNAPHIMVPFTHYYELTIVDNDNNPISGAKIEYTLRDKSIITKKDVFITGADGKMKVSIDATPDNPFGTITDYKSEFSYSISAKSYYTTSNIIQSKYGSIFNATRYSAARDLTRDPQTKSETVKLYKPTDYFIPSFLTSEKDSDLTKSISAFINAIRLQRLLTDSFLDYRSIDMAEFNGKKYLKFGFTNGIVYDSLKSNKYDIAKNIFDEVIRKVLNPLNEHISDSKKFFGYDLTIVIFTNSFTDKDTSKQTIEYRFFIPASAVKSYKEKDISGQQLLDKSIILMKDERIDLKLQ